MITVQEREEKTYTVQPNVVLERKDQYELRVDMDGVKVIFLRRGYPNNIRTNDIRTLLEEWDKIR